jgi:ABC-type branched-subunit amino acid transport system permease subunit
MLQLFVSGLPAGGMYALGALGIVLIYRTTGILTFAQGSIAMSTAYVFKWLWADHGWPLAPAIVGALGFAATVGVVLALIMRMIGEGQVLAQVIATVGVSGVLTYTFGEVFGYESQFVPRFFWSGRFELFGVFFGYDQAAIVVTAGLLAVALGLILTRTRAGTGLRGMSQNRLAARLAGLPIQRLEILSWVTGAVLAGVAGILLAPLLFLDIVQFSLFFLVKPFAAAVVGGLVSLPVAFAGGLFIGATESMLTRYATVTGLSEILPFVIMVGALLLRRNMASAVVPPLAQTPARRPGAGRIWPAAAAVAAVAAALPALDPARLTTVKLGIVFALLALSLVILTGWVGQVSLAQGAFFGLGGFLSATLGTRLDLPLPLVLVAVPLLTVPFAVFLGLTALRFRGLVLAVVTLAFGTLCFFSLFQWEEFTGGRDGSRLSAPEVFGVDLGTGTRWAYVMLVVAAGTFAAIRNVGRYGGSDAFFAAREAEEGAAALGLSVIRAKLAAFALSGAVAALAGVLLAYDTRAVSFESYSPQVSFTVFALAVFAGVESLWGAALAGMLYAGSLELADTLNVQGDLVQLISSAGVVVSLMFLPGGLVTLPARLRDRLTGRTAATADVGSGRVALDAPGAA